MASCPVTTPGTRRRDSSGVATCTGWAGGATDTGGGSPRSAVCADERGDPDEECARHDHDDGEDAMQAPAAGARATGR